MAKVPKQLPQQILNGVIKELEDADNIIPKILGDEDVPARDVQENPHLEMLNWRNALREAIYRAWRDPAFKDNLLSNDPKTIDAAFNSLLERAVPPRTGYMFNFDIAVRCVPDVTAVWDSINKEWKNPPKVTIELPIPRSPDHTSRAADAHTPHGPLPLPTGDEADAIAALDSVLTKKLGILGAGNC